MRQIIYPPSTIVKLPNFFGDSSDGDATITSGTTTLTEDKNYSKLTIDSGATIATAGYRIYVNGFFVNNGTVSNNATNATTANPGVGGAGVSVPFGRTGALAKTTAGLGNSAATQTYPMAPHLAGTDGGGGAAGGNSGGGPGDDGNDGLSLEFLRSVPNALLLIAFDAINNDNTVDAVGAGLGGGGGANVSGASNSGGPGGGGGGAILISARSITNNGTISSTGGNGGAATGAGVNGGGGGGQGGLIVLVGLDIVQGTTTVTGGTGGAKTSTGVAGQSGASGAVVVVQGAFGI